MEAETEVMMETTTLHPRSEESETEVMEEVLQEQDQGERQVNFLGQHTGPLVHF